ncbi:MAG: sulfotransferase domain-containing protein [Planctomycetota bacterium]
MPRFRPRVKDWLGRSPLRRIVVYRRHRTLRPTDRFLASYPKSGNTWLRHVLTHCLTGLHTQWQSPFLEYSIIVGRHHDLVPVFPGQGRMIKTHEPFHPSYMRSVLLIRDPRDVAVSQFHFNKQYSAREIFRRCDFDQFLDLFLSGKSCVYSDWGSHTRSWLPSIDRGDTLVIRYEDMRADPDATLHSVLDFFEIDVPAERFRAAIDDNTATRMREKEKEYRQSIAAQEPASNEDSASASNPTRGVTAESQRVFVRQAKSGGWKDLFTPGLLDRLTDAYGDLMQRFGYLETNAAADPASNTACTTRQ